MAKDDPRVRAYGEVDELNAAVGQAASLMARTPAAPAAAALDRVQEDLFAVGALLAAGPSAKIPAAYAEGLPPAAAARLEGEIDAWTKDLPQLKHFILPGGHAAGAALHLARGVCRRAERSVVALGSGAPAGVLVYLNRLSDHLFTAARWVNAKLGAPERPWAGL